MRAMCGAISQQRDEGTRFDFVLATGEVAYAGKPQDYRLAAGFFEAVGAASGVPKASIFCVPGNHDIDRPLGRGRRSHSAAKTGGELPGYRYQPLVDGAAPPG